MIGLLLRFPRNPAMVYRGIHARYGDTVLLHDFIGRRWLFIAGPDDIRRVHRDNHRAYGRGQLNEPFTEFLGNGLLTGERDTWSRHRRLMNPYFHGEHQRSLVAAAGRELGALLSAWEARRDGGPFDICPDLELFTYRVVASGMFDLGDDDEASTIHALDSALQYVSMTSFRMIGRPQWLPSRARRRFRAHLKVLDDLLSAAISAARTTPRRAASAGRGGLLAELVDSRHGLADAEIRDEILTMLHAGQHTVASGLAFALYLIATHPPVEARLMEEIAPYGGRVPDSNALVDLPYLDAVIAETLRLYPPAWGGVREALEPDELDGLPVPAGTPVVFSQFITHRHPVLWSDPDSFIPERPDASRAAANDYRYFPFGGGPHLCIGQELALLEMKLALTAILTRFKLHPVQGRPLRPLAMLDLVPDGGVHMSVTARG